MLRSLPVFGRTDATSKRIDSCAATVPARATPNTIAKARRCMTSPNNGAMLSHGECSGCDDVDVVQAERAIGSNQRQLFHLRLRHQQPVERIAMTPRQRGATQRMAVPDRKETNTQRRAARGNEMLDRLREPQLPFRFLQRHLPHAAG